MKNNPRFVVFLQKTGWWFLLVLTLYPVILWFMHTDLSLKFRTMTTTYSSIGQLTGLVGMAMFALSLALSARVKWFEYFFKGVNDVYVAHHTYGGLSLVFLLLHPLALAMVYAQTSYAKALTFLLPGLDWKINLGVASLYLLLSLLVLTYYVSLKYEIWLKTHKYLGLAFFLGGLHSFFVPSDISRISSLWWYMMVLSVLGLGAYTYRTLLNKYFVQKYRYSVTDVQQLPNNVTQIILKPLQNALQYKAGQFIFIEFKHPLFSKESHPFSIGSSPGKNGALSLAIKTLGDYTEKLPMLQVGTEALIEGPYGVFDAFAQKYPEQVWIAGGIGVVPFLSMARSLQDVTDSSLAITLYYSVRNAEEAVYLDELLSLSASDQRLHIIPYYSKEQGRLTAELIASQTGYSDPNVFICGPLAMMKSLKKQFTSLGLAKERIHTEEFAML